MADTQGAEAAWIALLRAHRSCLRRIDARLKAASLPPLAWYDVLWEIERAGVDGIRPVQLERRVILEQSNVSRLITRLVRAGYVERCGCPTDKRGQTVHLSASGRAMRRRMWPIYQQAIADVVGTRLPAARARQLSVLLAPFVEPTSKTA
jgi:DNA-binding MarR family transcriptional regulator